VAAESGADFMSIAEALRADGWVPVLLTDLPVRAAPLGEVIRTAMTSVTLVIGILSGAVSDSNVLFELGMASAMNKPIIVVVAPDVAIPSDLHAFPLVRLAPDARDSLALALRHVWVRHARSADNEESGISALGPRTDDLLETVSQATSESDLSLILAEALELSGATVVREGHAGSGRFDLGVWSVELAALVGNPFLIEVRRRLLSPGDAKLAGQQVSKYLSAVGGSWAMVVYGEGPPSGAYDRDLSASQVLVLRADELITRMREDSFPEVVRRLRNRRAHSSWFV
jgi:hypothetical protein